MTFPDEKMIEKAASEIAENLNETLQNGAIIARAAFRIGFTDYRTRTGIDVADVIAKLSAGTHVVVPVEPSEAMCVASALALDKEKQRLGLNVQNPKAFKPNAKHAIRYAAMIHAAQEKVE